MVGRSQTPSTLIWTAEVRPDLSGICFGKGAVGRQNSRSLLPRKGIKTRIAWSDAGFSIPVDKGCIIQAGVEVHWGRMSRSITTAKLEVVL